MTKMFEEIMTQGEKVVNCETYNKEKLVKLASEIKRFNPKNIVIVGRGTSYHAGVFAKYLFEMYYGIPVSIASQSVTTVYKAKIDYSNSLIIGISQSGQGLDNLDSIIKGNEAGALTVGITNELGNMMAKTAKYILYMNADKAEAYAATKTLTNSLYLIIRLLYELTNKEELNINLDRLVNIINETIGLKDLIKEKASNFKDRQELFTLARGYSLSLAMELALKLKEACLMHTSSYPTSEFFHGPVAMINKNTPAIFFGVDKVTNSNVKEMIEQFNKKDIFSLVITNDKELSSTGKDSIYFESNGSILDYFKALIIAQIFTNELAVLKGTDPDFNASLEHINTF